MLVLLHKLMVRNIKLKNIVLWNKILTFILMLYPFFISGELIMNSRFNTNLWAELVPKLIFDSRMSIKYQRPARNVGLEWNYLKKRSFDHGGVLQLDDVEIVYKDIGRIMKK